MELVAISRLQIRIKGSRVGRTVLNHKSSPLLAPLSTGAGNKSMAANREIRDRGRESFFSIWILSGIKFL